MRVPVLWHLKVSNYNEKARWALDYKHVPHVRRAVEPGAHRAVARKLTGGRTFPILERDGDAIDDSTAIIAALERRHADPPLYPADPHAWKHALELEDYFDEQLGPYVRLLVLHHLLDDPRLFLATFTPDMAAVRRPVARAMFGLIRRRLTAEFGIDERSVEAAFDKIRLAGERLRAEQGSAGYLVGDDFTVADLTLAALAAPAVCPVQFPYPQPQRGHPLLAPVRDALAAAGILRFTRHMYDRHRGTTAEMGAAAQRPMRRESASTSVGVAG